MVLTGNEAPLGLHVGTRLVVTSVTILQLVDRTSRTETQQLRSHADTKCGGYLIFRQNGRQSELNIV